MIRLPERPRRWVDLTLRLLVIGLCLAPLPLFLHRLRTNTLPSNAGLLEVVFGLLGFFILWRTLRRLLLWRQAGASIVQVSDAVVGAPLEYDLVLGREGTATLYCRQRKFRREVIVRVQAPLARAVFDNGLNRWRIRGRLTIPDAPPSRNDAVPSVEWQIDVRLTFGNGAVLEEDHPLTVRGP